MQKNIAVKTIHKAAATFFMIAAGAIAVIAGDSPANDNFANAEILSGIRVVVQRSNASATKEPNEPNHVSNPGGHSVWFRWTAPESGTMVFGTNRTATNLNTLLQVYTGSDLTALASRGSNNDVYSPDNLKSVVLINVLQGTTYSIVVDGASVGGSPAVQGAFTLDIHPAHPYQSADYDGDSVADLAVYRPSDSTWYINGTTHDTVKKWGTAGDIPVAMSLANGRSEPTVFRPSQGTFYYDYSINPVILQWGLDGDIPVPESYGGEVLSPFSVYRPSTGTWYVYVTQNQSYIYRFGLAGDIPVPGRYSHDANADVAVFRPSNGVWYILRRITGNPINDTFQAIQFGLPGDKPVPGDYDGDGLLDPAIFRPSTGTFWVLRSSDNQQHAFQWGLSTDIPVTGDFDEDGIFDFAVFRPSEGNWYIRNSETGSVRIEHWGTQGDIPMTSNLR